MNAEINAAGHLLIERAGKLKTQYCPFAKNADDPVCCGDWCPLFGEPEHYDQGLVWISMCYDSVLKLDSLIDNRPKKS